MNLFGVPITDATLRAMPRYRGREITQVDRAREATRLIHADSKNLDALDFAWKSKERYGNGVSTLVLIYNATGNDVTLEDRQDWYGYVYSTQPPRTIHNGQWISFLHVKQPAQAQGSEGARVFRGQDVNGRKRDFMVAWDIPFDNLPSSVTSAYTEIGDQGYFSSRWATMRARLRNARRITRAEDQNCVSTVSIGGYTTSDFIAVLQHKFQPLPEEL